MDREVAQLLLQVDANIAVAQREVQTLARIVRQSTGDMNTSLATTEVAHQRLGRQFGQTRIAQMELSHVVTASVDAYAAGASPLRILTLEMGRVAEAATFMGGGGGALGKVGAFMSGPWGIAMLFGVTILGQLIAKHHESGDSIAELVEKMRKEAAQAAENKQADLIWQGTIDGLIDRNEKLIDTLKKRLKAEEDLDEQTLKQARRDAATAQSDLVAAKTRLTNLQAQQAANDNANATGGPGIRAESIAPVARNAVLASQIAQAQQDVAKAQQAVESARAAITQNVITVGEQEGKALADLGAAADLWSKRYIAALHGIENANHGALAGSTDTISAGFYALDKAVKAAAGAGLSSQFQSARVAARNLGNELSSGKVTAQQYADKMRSVAASLDAAVKAAQNAKKGTGEVGKQIGFADAEAIAKGAGLTVTSGYRSVARQAELYNDPNVNKPGNPVARPGTSAHNGLNGKWALDIAFAPGITAQSLKKLYGDQGVSLSAVYKESGHFHIEGSRSQAAASENAAARAAQKQQTDDDQFAKESAQLDAETLAARRQLVAGYDTQADIAAAEVEEQRKAAQDSIRKQLDAHQITVDQAKILGIQADDRAAAQQAVVARRKLADLLDQQQKAVEQAYGFQLDDLRFADEFAHTQSEHRALQLQILDIQYKQKEADLQHLLDTVQRNKDFATSIDLQKQAAAIQGELNRLPTDKAHDQARVDKGTMSPLEAYNSELPHTLDDVKQRLDEIKVEGLKALNDDLVSATTKALKLHGALGDVFGMLLKLGLDVAEGAILSAFHIPARASGGPVAAGQAYIVGEHRPELFVPGTSGMILPSVPKLRIPQAAANDRGDTVNVYQSMNNNFAGGAATQDDVQRMGLVARTSAIQAIREERRRSAR